MISRSSQTHESHADICRFQSSFHHVSTNEIQEVFQFSQSEDSNEWCADMWTVRLDTATLLVSCSTAPWVSQFPLELRSWTRFSRVKMSPRKLRSPSLAKLSSMRFLCCSTNATTKTCGRTKTSHLLWRSVSIVHFWLLPDIKVSQVSLTSKLAFRRSLYCQYFVNSRTRTWSCKWSGESTNYFLSTQLRL